MHWAYEYAQKLKTQKTKDDDEIVIAAGTSPSGTVHIGNFRDIITSYFIVKALKQQGENAKLLFSWDDYDRFRKVPKNIASEKQGFYETQIGKPYSMIPSPFEDGMSYAKHFEKEYEDSLKKVGIIPDIIRYQSEEYLSGRYTEQTIEALQKRKEIFDILSEHRTQKATEKDREGYYPLSVYCKCCDKDMTKILSFDEKSKIEYHCDNCDINDEIDLRTDRNYKLSWKTDWPMRWKEEHVRLEPGGTDHAAEHGSYTVSKQISNEVFGYKPPEFVPYAFIGIKGAAVKMSSSSGINISLDELLKIYSPQMILWMYAKRQLNDEFKIDLGADVPRVYKEYNKFLKDYYENPENATETTKQIVQLISCSKKEKDIIPFDKLVTVYGMSNKNLAVMANMLRKLGLNVENTIELKDRLSRVFYWAENYSPESIVKVNKEPNLEYYLKMPSEQKKYIEKFLSLLQGFDNITEEDIMKQLYGIPKKSENDEITPELKKKQRQIFKDLYNLTISRDNGPALSTLIKALGTLKIKQIIEPLSFKFLDENDGNDVR